MLCLKVSHIEKSFGDRVVLRIPGFSVFSGDRVGVVGANGSGKTTLLRILSGTLAPDSGTVQLFCPAVCVEQLGEGSVLPADPKLAGLFGAKPQADGLSGGERTRAKLAGAFSRDGALLLADEPSANLDAEGLELLREKLLSTETLLLVSHDRDLLSLVCNRIVEIKDGELVEYSGGYEFYAEAAELERQRRADDYEAYAGQRKHLEAALSGRRHSAEKMRKAPSRMGNSEARLHKREATQRQQKLHGASRAIESRLERLDVVEKPREPDVIRLDFSRTDPPMGKMLLSCKGLNFSYGQRVLFRDAAFELPNRSRTVLSGPNGSGKTTLLSLIAQRHPSMTIAPKARFGVFRQSFEQLDLSATVLENAMSNAAQTETVVRTVLARLLFRREDVYKKVGVLSGGERVKLALAGLIVSSCNTLLLDEPTNFLDLPSVEALQAILASYEGTLLLISHDAAFVRAVTDRRLELRCPRIAEVAGEPSPASPDTRRFVLENRLAELTSRLSLPGAASKGLEAQYAETLEQLRALKETRRD